MTLDIRASGDCRPPEPPAYPGFARLEGRVKKKKERPVESNLLSNQLPRISRRLAPSAFCNLVRLARLTDQRLTLIRPGSYVSAVQAATRARRRLSWAVIPLASFIGSLSLPSGSSGSRTLFSASSPDRRTLERWCGRGVCALQFFNPGHQPGLIVGHAGII